MGKREKKKMRPGLFFEVSLARLKTAQSIYDLSPERRDAFYASDDWQSLRRWVLTKYHNVCFRCGATDRLCIDHIRPLSAHPRQALNPKNMQILCAPCNKKKSYLMATRRDMRPLSKKELIRDHDLAVPRRENRQRYLDFFPKLEPENEKTL